MAGRVPAMPDARLIGRTEGGGRRGRPGPGAVPYAQMRERLGGHEDPSLGPIRVRAASGERTLYPTVERLPTASPANCHLGAFLRVADAVVASIPLSSASMLTHTVALFFDFLDWAGYTGPPAVPPVIAFMVARAVPPADCPLPRGWLHPVLPTTAAGNVDALWRAARIGVPRAAPWLAPFESQAVFAFATPQSRISLTIDTNPTAFTIHSLPLLTSSSSPRTIHTAVLIHHRSACGVVALAAE